MRQDPKRWMMHVEPLDELIQKRGCNYSSISRLLGRNAAYIQQYIRRGSPRHLDEQDRSVWPVLWRR